MNLAKAIVGGVVTLIVALFVLGSFYTVNQTERGVLTRYGKVIGVAQPGLGFKLPVIDGVDDVSITTKTVRWDKMEAYSYDQQPATLHVSVTLHAEPTRVDTLYSRFGSLDAYVKQRVSPHVNQQVKVVFGGYTAVRAIQTREKLNVDVKDAILRSIGTEDLVVIESVQVEDIAFSQAYLTSIEQRMLAEVDVQKTQQNAQREKVTAEITVTKAQAEADSQLARAKADAEAKRLAGAAEAYAIEAKAKALAQNPALVSLAQAEKWDGKLPTTMVPGGSIPMLGLSK